MTPSVSNVAGPAGQLFHSAVRIECHDVLHDLREGRLPREAHLEPRPVLEPIRLKARRGVDLVPAQQRHREPPCRAEVIGALHGIDNVVGALCSDGAVACAIVGEEGDLETLGGAILGLFVVHGSKTVEVAVDEELLGARHRVGRGTVEEWKRS